MAKPLEKIIKEYPPRGPLVQFRFEKSLSFSCFRCGQNKVSKLVTLYNNDWNKRLCNGCYGRLLSIYEIKSGQLEIDEKAEKLSALLFKLFDENRIREQTKRLIIKHNKTKLLSSTALRFYATSECVAETLAKDPNLDWSPAIIGLCKAFEVEIIERIINPLKDLCQDVHITDIDLKDKDFGRIARICSGHPIKPPELGTISHFISTAINSNERFEKSDFLKIGFKGYISKRPKSNWLIDKDCLVSAIESLTKNYRNKAAHTDELERIDYDNCRELVFGDEGIMWDLILSTQTVK